ncbi:MAG TPA: hypothetical protein PL033_10440 [Candidatus Brocadiia bacterium]|nr:hypothetical protein [Candidatus Brocadiia bacterium]
MKEVKGCWTDVAQSYSLAFDIKKIMLGLGAVVGAFLWVTVAAYAYDAVGGACDKARGLADLDLYRWFTLTGAAEVARGVVSMGNPFAFELKHAVAAIIFDAGLFAIWAYFGGSICRLSALEYGRDEIPAMGEGMAYARRKFSAYLFTPLAPFFGILGFSICLLALGLLGRIPYVGPVILALGHFGVPFLAAPIAFMAVLGIISFGLMAPAVSVDGKDAFEGWSRAFGYLIWSPGRFFAYSTVGLLAGAAAILVGALFCETAIAASVKCVALGLGCSGEWFAYDWRGHCPCACAAGCSSALQVPSGAAGMNSAASLAFFVFMMMRAAVAGFAVAYYFSCNSVIYLLMRKAVDRVDIKEICDLEEADELARETSLPAPPMIGVEGADDAAADQPGAQQKPASDGEMPGNPEAKDGQ